MVFDFILGLFSMRIFDSNLQIIFQSFQETFSFKYMIQKQLLF